jgi:hypothetical protein
MKKSANGLRDFWDTIKHYWLHIIGIPEGDEREKGTESIFQKILAENFPSLRKEIES